VVTTTRLTLEVRRAARIAGFGALTTAMLPGLMAHERMTPEAQRDRVRRRWVGAWAGSLLRIFGVSAIVRHDAM